MDFRKNVGSPFQESPRDGRTIDCLLVAAAPDVHLLRVGDELLAEVGMRDADERLGTLPGGKTLEVDHAVLGDDVVRAGARVGADGAGRQRGNDAALDRAVLAGDGRGHADEALAALGEVSAHGKVELAARAGDVLDAGGLGIHLTEQIAVDGVVDGDEVVDHRDDVHVVRVIDRRTHDLGIAIHVVIELLRAGGEGKDLTALVELLVLAGDLAGEGHVDKAVDIHFGVNGQVLEVRLRDHRADGVGHAADAELEARALPDLGHDELGDRALELAGTPNIKKKNMERAKYQTVKNK